MVAFCILAVWLISTFVLSALIYGSHKTLNTWTKEERNFIDREQLEAIRKHMENKDRKKKKNG